MPGDKKHHTDKFRRCVEEVMAKGNDESSAYAICTTSLEKAGEPIFEAAEESMETVNLSSTKVITAWDGSIVEEWLKNGGVVKIADQLLKAGVLERSAEQRHLHLCGATGTVRREVLHGRPHLVVPVVALMEGVISPVNAGGPEFVPLSTLQKAAASWNGRPVTLGHPVRNGTQCSANSPDIRESHAIGTIFNSHVEGRKLLQEAWLDEELTKTRHAEMYQRLLDSKPEEVSVGAFVVTSGDKGVFNGKPYGASWLETFGDHLAFLPGKRGACSVAMGCGAHRAAEEQPVLHIVHAESIDAEEPVTKTFADHFRAAMSSLRAAVGKRNSATDLAMIQTVHDHATALGAECYAKNIRFMEQDEDLRDASSDDQPRDENGRWTSSAHGTVVAESKLGAIAIVKRAGSPVKFKARNKDGDVVGTASTLREAKELLMKPNNMTELWFGNKADTKWKHLEDANLVIAARYKDCAACDGSGSKDGNPCEVCEGTGELKVAGFAHHNLIREQVQKREESRGDGNFDEDKHPREDDGKFAGGGGGSKSDEKDGPKKKSSWRERFKKYLEENPDTVPEPLKVLISDLVADDAASKQADDTASPAEVLTITAAADAAASELRAACSCKESHTMNAEQKAALINELVTNKHSGFTAGDEKTLEAFSDERLESFKVAAEARANTERDLRAAADRKLTREEFMAVAPPELTALIKRQERQDTELKAALISELKVAQAEYSEAELSVMPTADLQRMARMAKVEPKIDYSGRAIPRALAQDDEEDFTPPNSYDKGIKALQAVR